MSHEAVLIENQGYTETLYPTCGEYLCTATVLRSVGVPGKVVERERAMVSDFPLGDDVFVSVSTLGESNNDAWCAAPECGEFLCHGLNCGCEHDEYGDKIDPEFRTGPHPFL
jgi:hypothetical protein